jgi:hypothetical protein
VGDDKSVEFVTRSLAATVAATVGLAGPEYGAVATALTPMAEIALARLFDVFDWRRRRHINEAMVTAAEARSETVEELLKRALEDDVSQELFVRVGVAARDAALRDKRVASAARWRPASTETSPPSTMSFCSSAPSTHSTSRISTCYVSWLERGP